MILLFSAFAKAQDSTEVAVPKIYVKAFQGKKTVVEAVSIRLVQVLEDSRCPSGVDCVWAGRAKIEVEVIDLEGTKIIKEITLNRGDLLPIYAEHGLAISIRGLAPYPKVSSKIKASDYYLLLEVSN